MTFVPATTWKGWLGVMCLMLLSFPSAAETWKFTDATGAPLPNVAVEVFALDAATTLPDPVPEPVEIRQQKQAFLPDLTVIPVGSQVTFPNLDRYAHHVYSFSKAKAFELELYKGDDHPPMVFDKTGMVRLACNIHDGMRGYILVTDAPWFGKASATGVLDLDLPPGSYTVHAWHPQLREPQVRTIEVPGAPVAWQLEVRPAEKASRGLGAWAKRKS